MEKVPFLPYLETYLDFWLEKIPSISKTSHQEAAKEIKRITHIVEFCLTFPQVIDRINRLMLIAFSIFEAYGKTQLLVSSYETAIEHSKGKRPLIEQVKLINQLGHAYRIQQNFSTAIRLHKNVLLMISANLEENAFLIAQTHFHLCENYLRIQQFEEAEVAAKQALQFFNNNNSYPHWEAATTNSLGLIYQQQKEHNKAISLFNRAIEICKTYEYSLSLARSLKNIAMEFQAQSKLEKAKEHYQHAIGLLADNPIERCEILNCLGTLYFSQSKYLRAVSIFEEANIEGISIKLKASINHNIGVCYLRAGDLNKAINHLKTAVTLREKVESELDLAHTLGVYAEALFYLKSFEPSLQMYNRAISILKNYPFENELVIELQKEKAELINKMMVGK